MVFIYLLISVLSGAFVGHAATVSWRKETFSSFENILVGALGGGLGGVLLHYLGWYSQENLFGLTIGAMLGFMIFSSVTAGIALSIALAFKKN